VNGISWGSVLGECVKKSGVMPLQLETVGTIFGTCCPVLRLRIWSASGAGDEHPARSTTSVAFNESSTHDLIDRRFHKGGTDGFSLPSAFAEVGNEFAVITDIRFKCRQALGYLGG
jgi:hypothetical protein